MTFVNGVREDLYQSLLKLKLFQKTADKKPTHCALKRRFQVDHVVVSMIQPNCRRCCVMLMLTNFCVLMQKCDPGFFQDLFTVRHESWRVLS
jgi:hypothetical protein